MKNITDIKPTSKLLGRLVVATEMVREADIKDRDILDIGCGYGWCELNFLKRGAKSIVGTEITEADFATAKKYIDDQRVKFVVGGATQLEFPDKSFDSVVCWEVIEHIPKRTEPQMFAEVNRVLRPGGAFYLSTPFASVLARIFDPAWWVAGHRHYSRAHLEAFGLEHGFEVSQMMVKGRFWTLFSILNMYIAKWIFRRPPFFAEHFSKMEDYEYRHGEGFFNIFVRYQKVNDLPATKGERL